jgi:hypothetical protein
LEPVTEEIATLYRPLGLQELELIVQSGYRRWPPRLPGQPFFYPVANEEYARQIAESWNVPANGAGFVARFQVKKSFMDRYPLRQVGGKQHQEWWIPAQDLDELNENIVGLIEVVGEFP